MLHDVALKCSVHLAGAKQLHKYNSLFLGQLSFRQPLLKCFFLSFISEERAGKYATCLKEARESAPTVDEMRWKTRTPNEKRPKKVIRRWKAGEKN